MRLPSGFKPQLLALVAVASVGLGLRLASMRESLWLDELSTLWAVEASFADVIRRVPQVMGQSPFYFSIVWASVHTLGESELALRLPSLIAGILCPIVIASVASSLGGRRAAAWSFVFFWLCYPAIWTSVDARPYAVAMCFAAVATLGFTRACLRGRPRDRVLWMAGAAGLVWTHYVFVPFLLAYPVGYFTGRRAHAHYPPKKFLMDAMIIVALLLPAIPQLAGIVSDRHAQAWMFAPKHLGMAGQLVPFLLAMVFPGRGGRDESLSEIRRTLGLAVVTQLVALEAAALFGIDLVSTRYASVTIVAAAILAGENVARLTRADIIAPVAMFVVSTAMILFATDRIAGSYSGAGYQEWRQAVAALRPELERAAGAPVLFRSGNAEDDLGIPGQLAWPATLAPLRSPGNPAPHWNIVLLTYRWHHPFRPTYFQEVVHTRLENQPVFFLLCLRSDEPDSNGYCDNVESWIRQTWPEQIRATPLGPFRQLSVVRFDRRR